VRITEEHVLRTAIPDVSENIDEPFPVVGGGFNLIPGNPSSDRKYEVGERKQRRERLGKGWPSSIGCFEFLFACWYSNSGPQGTMSIYF